MLHKSNHVQHPLQLACSVEEVQGWQKELDGVLKRQDERTWQHSPASTSSSMSENGPQVMLQLSLLESIYQQGRTEPKLCNDDDERWDDSSHCDPGKSALILCNSLHQVLRDVTKCLLHMTMSSMKTEAESGLESSDAGSVIIMVMVTMETNVNS